MITVLLATIVTGYAQNVDNFEVGPYEVDYNEDGEYKYRLRHGVDLYKYFGLKKDTIIMKKFIALALACAMTLSLVACGSGSTTKATKAADDKYLEATAEYTITIDLAKQTFSFADGSEVFKFYGIKEYMNAPIPTVDTSKADGIGHGTGDFVYTIESNNIGATIPDENTGKVVFGDSTQKVGTVTVNVTSLFFKSST